MTAAAIRARGTADRVRFARALVAARHRRGWSQGDLARAIRTSQSVVSRFERGDDVRLSTALRYAHAVGFLRLTLTGR